MVGIKGTRPVGWQVRLFTTVVGEGVQVLHGSLEYFFVPGAIGAAAALCVQGAADELLEAGAVGQIAEEVVFVGGLAVEGEGALLALVAVGRLAEAVGVGLVSGVGL